MSSLVYLLISESFTAPSFFQIGWHCLSRYPGLEWSWNNNNKTRKKKIFQIHFGNSRSSRNCLAWDHHCPSAPVPPTLLVPCDYVSLCSAAKSIVKFVQVSEWVAKAKPPFWARILSGTMSGASPGPPVPRDPSADASAPNNGYQNGGGQSGGGLDQLYPAYNSGYGVRHPAPQKPMPPPPPHPQRFPGAPPAGILTYR